MGTKHAAVVAGLALGLMSGTAKAELLHFSYDGSAQISFNLDSQQTPSRTVGNFIAAYDGYDVTLNGKHNINNEIGFGTVGGNPQFSLYAPGSNFDLNAYGGQVFSGSVSDPTFMPGVFTFFGDSGGAVLTTLTVTAISSVPLPSSAPMFGAAILALGAVGYGVKRKKSAAAA